MSTETKETKENYKKNIEFLGVIPKKSKLISIEATDTFKALAQVGLKSGEIDFGTITHNLSIVVFQYGLMEPCSEGYFSIGSNLYAGNALIFRTDGIGETIDTTLRDIQTILANIRYYSDVSEVENAIYYSSEGATPLERPTIAVNGEVLATWRNGSFDNINKGENLFDKAEEHVRKNSRKKP